jgi:glyoxylase-like metal-dependent hydrolase (beta-lactamase superfamily II)
MMRVPCGLEETAVSQIEQRGFAVEDVKHIIYTHLHLDHAGGLPDFPHARTHVYRPEYEAAMHPRGPMGPFFIQQHWVHGPQWIIHDLAGEKWFDFDAIPISSDIWLIPLLGHTSGHCGVAVRDGDGWLLHCGDAISPFYAPADSNRPSDKPLSWLAKQLIGSHAPHLRRFRETHRDTVRLISGHDIHSFREFNRE